MDQQCKEKLVPDGGAIYRKYSASDIIEAARMVQEDRVSVYKAAKEKGIPWSSLKRYVTENPEVNPALNLKKLGRPFALEPEMEQKVFSYVISMQELGFGLTVEQVKVVAFEVAEASGRGHFFNKQKRRASKKWWRNFKERYGLTLRVPENLSSYRASMGNPVMVDDYFDKLSETTKKLKIQDNLKDHIWNVDETGLMFVVKANKVVAEIGKKFIYRRTYSERGETMTLVGCICANGTWIPPFIVFKGSRWNEAYKKDCLPNTQVHLSDRGWITKELFLTWFQFFLDCTNGSPKPMLLLMDSHGAHITPQVIELAKENDVHILTFPSHTTHILQPLDVGVYKSLKSAWQRELNDYMAEHPTDKPNKQVFHSIFKVPFIKAMSDKTIKNAFRSCGIVPFDRTAIPEEKLAPSLLTERSVPEEVVPSDANLRPKTSETNMGIQTPPSPVDNILKLPKAGPRKASTRGRVDPKAKLITENPPTVHETLNKQHPQKRRKVEVQLAAPGPSGISHQEKAKKKKTNVSDSSARLSVDDNDWTCGVCSECFSKDKKVKNGKKWVQCSFCLTPYHELCQSEPVTSLVYMCDFCSSG